MFESMKDRHVERLFVLSRFMKTVKNEKFDLSTWCNRDRKCGTVACVLGWAGNIPEFRKIGLKATTDLSPTFTPKTAIDIEDCRRVIREIYKELHITPPTCWNPKLTLFNAGAGFFGLSKCQSARLFGNPEAYGEEFTDAVTPRLVSETLLNICKVQNLKLTRKLQRTK